MILLQIIMAIIITTAIYSFGKMFILDTIDILCFNPNKFSFKDDKGVWKLTECERKRYSGHLPFKTGGRFDREFPECHHNSTHNLTMTYESNMNESTTNAFELGKLAKAYHWQSDSIEYITMKNNIKSWKIDNAYSPFRQELTIQRIKKGLKKGGAK